MSLFSFRSMRTSFYYDVILLLSTYANSVYAEQMLLEIIQSEPVTQATSCIQDAGISCAINWLSVASLMISDTLVVGFDADIFADMSGNGSGEMCMDRSVRLSSDHPPCYPHLLHLAAYELLRIFQSSTLRSTLGFNRQAVASWKSHWNFPLYFIFSFFFYFSSNLIFSVRS